MTFETFSALKRHLIRRPNRLLAVGSLCLLCACGGGSGTSGASAIAASPEPSLARTDNGADINPGYDATFVPLFSYGSGYLTASDGSMSNKPVKSGELQTVNPSKTTTYRLDVKYQDPNTVRTSILPAEPAYLSVNVNTLPDIIPKTAEIQLTPDKTTVISPPGTVIFTLTYPTPANLVVQSTKLLINGVEDTSIVGVIQSGQTVTKPGLIANTSYKLLVTYADTRDASSPTSTVPSATQSIVVQTGAGTVGTTADMKVARSDFSATLIESKGQILVCGGVDANAEVLSSCEIYDPSGGAKGEGVWRLTKSMGKARRGHAATLLDGGNNVLISGGSEGPSATALSKSTEIFDFGAESVKAGPTLVEGRSGHSSIRLHNGKVLIFGGAVSSGNGTVAELFDPGNGTPTITATGPLITARQDHTATLLPTGEVIVTGRTDSEFTPYLTNSQTFEIYDPVDASWTLGAVRMKVGRSSHAASLLPYNDDLDSIKVLITGGSGIAASTTAEILTRTNTAGTVTWAPSASTIAMPTASPRSFHTSTTLSTGDVLLIGGKGKDTLSTDLTSTDLFVATDAEFSAVSQKKLNYARSMHKSIRLANDSVLIFGNYFKSQGKVDSKVELWSPPTP